MKHQYETRRNTRNHRGLAKDRARKARLAEVEVILNFEILGQRDHAVRLTISAFEFEANVECRFLGEADDGVDLVGRPEPSGLVRTGFRGDRDGGHTGGSP